MNCIVTRLANLAEDTAIREYVIDKLTKPDSDFQRMLKDGSNLSGHIALVFDQGEIIGWARTAEWKSCDTLEAFVAAPYRLRGVAAFAAAGLYATVLHDAGSAVAVFDPKMLLVARRAGMFPVLYEKRDGQWVAA